MTALVLEIRMFVTAKCRLAEYTGAEVKVNPKSRFAQYPNNSRIILSSTHLIPTTINDGSVRGRRGQTHESVRDHYVGEGDEGTDPVYVITSHYSCQRNN